MVTPDEAAVIAHVSTRGQPRSRAIGRTGHRSGITAALHWHRTPATGALIFLFRRERANGNGIPQDKVRNE
jgi:hypothetical protein